MTAEHTHRALLNISTGELGSYQFRIEHELKRLLTYASTFQAIVLIDEADVFLEERKSGPSDALEQNAMVAGKCHVNHPLYLLSLKSSSISTTTRVLPRHHIPHIQPSLSLRSSHQIPYPSRASIRQSRQIRPKNSLEKTPCNSTSRRDRPQHRRSTRCSRRY
jgi:hypothetical protein